MKPFANLGMNTLTIRPTGGTDHQSFDAVGLPGFQFVQDPLEYGSRTHHTNLDVYERAIPEDLDPERDHHRDVRVSRRDARPAAAAQAAAEAAAGDDARASARRRRRRRRRPVRPSASRSTTSTRSGAPGRVLVRHALSGRSRRPSAGLGHRSRRRCPRTACRHSAVRAPACRSGHSTSRCSWAPNIPAKTPATFRAMFESASASLRRQRATPDSMSASTRARYARAIGLPMSTAGISRSFSSRSTGPSCSPRKTSRRSWRSLVRLGDLSVA